MVVVGDNTRETSALVGTDSSLRATEGKSWGYGRKIGLVMVATMLVGCCLWLQTKSSGAKDSLRAASELESADIPLLCASNKKTSKKSDKKKKDSSDVDTTLSVEGEDDSLAYCMDGKYSKRTLKLAYELPFISLFKDTKGQKKHEASSVVVVDNEAYAICDSSWSISKFSSQLQPYAPGNVQVGDPNRDPDEESGYEALFYEDGMFYAIRESVEHDDATYHAIIEELTIMEGAQDYVIEDACSTEFEFEGDSKGFEGAIALRDLDNELVILGLCEGNHCSEKKKNDKGNGKFVAMKKTNTQSLNGPCTCIWETIRKIKIPPTADFLDYSAASLSPDGKMAITSQENSQLWIGQMLGQQENGLWDIDAIEFEEEGSVVYDFPKDNQCNTIYCNIEGIHWLNDETLIAVSDKMKSNGRQDFRCFDKDQSVHVFALP